MSGDNEETSDCSSRSTSARVDQGEAIDSRVHLRLRLRLRLPPSRLENDDPVPSAHHHHHLTFSPSSPSTTMARPTPNAVNNILRGSLGTMPGPGGAGSIGHYTQPCRKVVLSYCASSPASAGVRDWLTKKWGAVQLAKQWPQIEWVVKEGKRGSEPHVTAHYGESTSGSVLSRPLSNQAPLLTLPYTLPTPSHSQLPHQDRRSACLPLFHGIRKDAPPPLLDGPQASRLWLYSRI